VNRYETETKKAAIRSSLSVILLADSSKFGIVTPSHFAELGEIDTVITDDGISQEYREIMQHAGVECLIASSPDFDQTASHSV
jgi:DeoR family deoxyribose operon repressor